MEPETDVQAVQAVQAKAPEAPEALAEALAEAPEAKRINVVSAADLLKDKSDIETFGDLDTFQLICKASSKEQGWMKSTKAMRIEGLGLVLQVTTQIGQSVAEAVTFVPGATLRKRDGKVFVVKG